MTSTKLISLHHSNIMMHRNVYLCEIKNKWNRNISFGKKIKLKCNLVGICEQTEACIWSSLICYLHQAQGLIRRLCCQLNFLISHTCHNNNNSNNNHGPITCSLWASHLRWLWTMPFWTTFVVTMFCLKCNKIINTIMQSIKTVCV